MALLCGLRLVGTKKKNKGARPSQHVGGAEAPSTNPHLWHDTLALAQSGPDTAADRQFESEQFQRDRARFSKTKKFLQDVCAQNKAAYAILWQLGADNKLRVLDYFNPVHHVDDVKRQFSVADYMQVKLYTTESRLYSFKPGQGCVGKAFSLQQSLYYHEVARDAPKNFLRMQLAAKYNIRSVVFHPCAPTEVLEFGTAVTANDAGRFFRARKTSAIESSAESECEIASDLWRRNSQTSVMEDEDEDGSMSAGGSQRSSINLKYNGDLARRLTTSSPYGDAVVDQRFTSHHASSPRHMI